MITEGREGEGNLSLALEDDSQTHILKQNWVEIYLPSLFINNTLLLKLFSILKQYL